ncbi:hypothetical protein ACB098_03G090700 [Castanea mollissima]
MMTSPEEVEFILSMPRGPRLVRTVSAMSQKPLINEFSGNFNSIAFLQFSTLDELEASFKTWRRLHIMLRNNDQWICTVAGWLFNMMPEQHVILTKDHALHR